MIEKYTMRQLCASAAEADFSAVERLRDPDRVQYGVSEASIFRSDLTPDDIVGKITLPYPVVPSYAYLDNSVLASLLGFSREQLADIVSFRLAVELCGGATRLISMQEYFALIEKGMTDVYSGAEAVEALLGATDTDEALYSVQRAIFDTDDADERQRLRARQTDINIAKMAHLSIDYFICREIPVLPMVAKMSQDRDSRFFELDICCCTFLFWSRKRRFERAAEMRAPMLVFINEKRMLQELADKFFAALKNNEVFFNDRLSYLRAILSSVADEVVCKEDGNGVYCSIPVKFSMGENDIRIYVSKAKNGFDLSDNGFVMEYYRYDKGTDINKYAEQIQRLCESESLSFDGRCFSTHISDFDNPVVCIGRFLKFFGSLYTLSNIDLM